jgi:hypothetical protein
MRCRQFVFYRWLDDRDTRKLRHSVNELLPLGIARSCGVNDDILGIAGGSAKEVEYRYSVVGIRLAERVTVDINFGNVRYNSESCQFGRVRQVVVSKVDTLQR